MTLVNHLQLSTFDGYLLYSLHAWSWILGWGQEWQEVYSREKKPHMQRHGGLSSEEPSLQNVPGSGPYPFSCVQSWGCQPVRTCRVFATLISKHNSSEWIWSCVRAKSWSTSLWWYFFLCVLLPVPLEAIGFLSAVGIFIMLLAVLFLFISKKLCFEKIVLPCLEQQGKRKHSKDQTGIHEGLGKQHALHSPEPGNWLWFGSGEEGRHFQDEPH